MDINKPKYAKKLNIPKLITQVLTATAITATVANTFVNKANAQNFPPSEAATAKLNLERNGDFINTAVGSLTQDVHLQLINGKQYCVLPDRIHVSKGDKYGEYQVTDKHVVGFGAKICNEYDIELPATVTYSRESLIVETSESISIYYPKDNYDNGSDRRHILYVLKYTSAKKSPSIN
jgi:hypothetical protein